MSHHGRSRRVQVAAALLLTGCVLITAGCRPEAEPSESTQPTTSASPTPSGSTAPAATPTPTPTETAAGFVVPAGCEDIYSVAMLAALRADNPPLNDPDVTMLSTQDVDLLEIIDSEATIRCSWGEPSQYGLATNVTAIALDQADFIVDQLAVRLAHGSRHGDGTICRSEQKGITQDDEEYASGETHYVGGGAWVSTAWINFTPEGYTEDIVETLWG